MKAPSRATSRPNSIVCPKCERGEFKAQGPDLANCEACGRDLEDILLRTLEHIASLPDALGKHTCECGHPQMGHLPDGVFHCPA